MAHCEDRWVLSYSNRMQLQHWVVLSVPSKRPFWINLLPSHLLLGWYCYLEHSFLFTYRSVVWWNSKVFWVVWTKADSHHFFQRISRPPPAPSGLPGLWSGLLFFTWRQTRKQDSYVCSMNVGILKPLGGSMNNTWLTSQRIWDPLITRNSIRPLSDG